MTYNWDDYYGDALFATLKGLTLVKIEGLEPGSDLVTFYTKCGRTFTLKHYQDCCESVSIYDVVGDVEDLIGLPITMAEAVDGDTPVDTTLDEYQCTDSYTWTFYKLATIKGYVDIRWLGESNGYYSEKASFEEIK